MSGRIETNRTTQDSKASKSAKEEQAKDEECKRICVKETGE